MKITLVRETRTTRRVDIRVDSVGLYILFWQCGELAACVSYQYPTFIQRRLNGEMAAIHYIPGLSVMSLSEEQLEY